MTMRPILIIRSLGCVQGRQKSTTLVSGKAKPKDKAKAKPKAMLVRLLRHKSF
jgi:hypothetical protein